MISKSKQRKNRRRGFTLIELLVVIAIIGLLMSVAIVTISDARKKARDNVRATDNEQIKAAVQSYGVANGSYPDSLDDLVDIGVFTSVPTDPINEGDLVYSYQNNTSCYDLTYQKELPDETVEVGNCD